MRIPFSKTKLLLMLACILIPTGCVSFKNALPAMSKSTNQLPLRSVDQHTKAEACRLTGLELASHEKDEHAISQLEQAKKLEPELKGVAYPLAVLYDRQGRLDAAQREYERALLESPKNADLRNDFGYFLYSRKNYAESKKQLEQALKLKQTHSKARINLAMTLAAEGQLEEAHAHFEAALGPAAAHHNIGLICSKSGRKEEALAHLQQAAQIDPSLKSQSLLAALSEDTNGRSAVMPASYSE